MTDDTLHAWAVDFERQMRESFLRLAHIFEENAAEARNRWQAGTRARTDDPVDALRRLRQLRTEGLITEEEFEATKKAILSRL
ncbi:MAG: SHOCT domain-containing protein [Dehalococcoidia bacterium]|nr:SHOCT domain-containing protein [Dehalococcoidia bacterium]